MRSVARAAVTPLPRGVAVVRKRPTASFSKLSGKLAAEQHAAHLMPRMGYSVVKMRFQIVNTHFPTNVGYGLRLGLVNSYDL